MSIKYQIDVETGYTTPADMIDDLVDKGEALINFVAGLEYPYNIVAVEEVSKQVIMMEKVKMARDQHHLRPSDQSLAMLSGYLMQSAVQAFYVSHAIDQFLKQETENVE